MKLGPESVIPSLDGEFPVSGPCCHQFLTGDNLRAPWTERIPVGYSPKGHKESDMTEHTHSSSEMLYTMLKVNRACGQGQGYSGSGKLLDPVQTCPLSPGQLCRTRAQGSDTERCLCYILRNHSVACSPPRRVRPRSWPTHLQLGQEAPLRSACRLYLVLS